MPKAEEIKINTILGTGLVLHLVEIGKGWRIGGSKVNIWAVQQGVCKMQGGKEWGQQPIQLLF